jgi:hypothetical protein
MRATQIITTGWGSRAWMSINSLPPEKKAEKDYTTSYTVAGMRRGLEIMECLGNDLKPPTNSRNMEGPR